MLRDNEVATFKNWLPYFPDLAKITDASWLEAVQAARMRVIPRGTVLFRPGDSCVNFVLVLAGTLRVYIPSESGREIVLYRVDPGEICILTLCNLFGTTAHSAEGVAETDVNLVAIPLGLFEHTLTASHDFRRFIFSTIGRRLGGIMVLLEEIAFKRFDVRLAQYLLRCVGDNVNNPLHKTHQDLAAELGSSREVVSRLLEEFERNGWVRLDRGYIQILSRTNMERFFHIK